MKVNETDECKTLPPILKARHGNFLKRLPDLSKIPSTTITEPRGNGELTRRFESEEGRIYDRTKIMAFYELHGHVFRAKEEVYHWNIQLFVECRFRRIKKHITG